MSVRPERGRGDVGRPLPDEVDEAPGGEFFFRRGVVLAVEEELGRRGGLRELLRERGGGDGRDLGGGVREFLVDDVLGTVADARSERLGGPGAVEPDYVFFGAQTVKGGPWDQVEPATPPVDWISSGTVGGGITVGVLDTGVAFEPEHDWLQSRVTADPVRDRDLPTVGGAGDHLAEQGGHGTFVAGIVSRVAPAAHLAVARVLRPDGWGSTTTVLDGIDRALQHAAQQGDGRMHVLNLSLGGYTARDETPLFLGDRLRSLVADGTVVVAAAGNLASPRPFWPAAMPEVIGVGALDGHGPAVFTNYGPWVDACAPGVDVVSTYFDERPGPLLGVDLPQTQQAAAPVEVTFPGYGRWSGTSFAAPKVAGAIAAFATTWDVDVQEAADRLVRDWRLFRVPDLGVVVNVC